MSVQGGGDSPSWHSSWKCTCSIGWRGGENLGQHALVAVHSPEKVSLFPDAVLKGEIDPFYHIPRAWGQF